MVKKHVVVDTFEKIAETFNPLATSGESSNKQEKALKEKLENKKDNHTPLDFEKLKKQYEKNDSKNADVLRNRLFHLVRQGDEKILYEKRQKELGSKRQEVVLEQQKKKEQEKRKKVIQQGDLPKGKVRRSIFSTKKVAERQHQETKPATGKQ